MSTGMGGRGGSPAAPDGSGRSRSGIRLRAENTSLSWSAEGVGCGATGLTLGDVVRMSGERGRRSAPGAGGGWTSERWPHLAPARWRGGAERRPTEEDAGLLRRHTGLPGRNVIGRHRAGVGEVRPDHRVRRTRRLASTLASAARTCSSADF